VRLLHLNREKQRKAFFLLFSEKCRLSYLSRLGSFFLLLGIALISGFCAQAKPLNNPLFKKNEIETVHTQNGENNKSTKVERKKLKRLKL
jgi:hypothetical protein|tara:strand:+ start:16735 stop:17004 length:270 start_codon:yes stop_codon:yes gene_type:complete